jgi:AbrB family looped-hinge helix DNA binding protein
MSSTIKIAIDGAGRLVIPKTIRDQAGLKPGMALKIRLREGVIEIEPHPRKVHIERRGKLCVAVPDEQSTDLDESSVRETIRAVRSRKEALTG